MHMSGAPGRRGATYQDLLQVPEHLVAEILDGELITSPRPSARHAAVATRVASDIEGAFGRGKGGPGGWVILMEPELHLGQQILVPDLAAWRRDRMPEIPDAPFLESAPDWVCDVLSPSTAALDRTRKMHHYAASGIGFVWLLDPALQTLEVFRLDGAGWRLASSVAGPANTRAAPFDAIDLDLAALWAR
jgi:Uma2 family endonuclease